MVVAKSLITLVLKLKDKIIKNNQKHNNLWMDAQCKKCKLWYQKQNVEEEYKNVELLYECKRKSSSA